MISMRLHVSKHYAIFNGYFKLVLNVQRVVPSAAFCYTTSVDVLDLFTNDLFQRHKCNLKRNSIETSALTVRRLVDGQSQVKTVANLSNDEIDKIVSHAMTKGNDKQIESIISKCIDIQKRLEDKTMTSLLTHYSNIGRVEVVLVLQKYYARLIPIFYQRNGELTHYVAKAQCIKGNSEKGLLILQSCYEKHVNLRNVYRILFKELIQDSVLNRSEATLVIFKKFVLEFSDKFKEHYPLVCFWHICWLSSWFSDQMLSQELLDSSIVLQDIIKERATAFSITALKYDFNEDAVVRLLQSLLRYKMMTEYIKVLQVFFDHKIRNRDIRGCSEIIRNCEALGVMLPSDQQRRYIKLLIDGKVEDHTIPIKNISKHFKLKF